MKITNIFKTKTKLVLKNLILNESRTFIVGKVQNKNSKLDFISTKWEINKEKKICICALNDADYDISLEGIFIPGLIEEKKKNFYTFDKNAWHCKLYKWVYGKEPHKVHPTMCPYFWIMVITLFPPVFMVILIIKLFGKTGTAFMEKCSTFQARNRERKDEIKRRKRENWVKKISESYQSFSMEELSKLFDTPEWDNWHYDIDWNIKQTIKSNYQDWKHEQRILKVEREHEAYLKNEEIRRAKREKEITKELKKKQTVRKIELPTIKKDSKTVKIIGIGLITLFIGFCTYLLLKATVYMFKATDWLFVGKWVMWIALFILGCFALYCAVIYLLIPLFTYVIIPLFTRIIIPSVEWFYNKIILSFCKYCIELPFKYLIYKPIKYGVVKPISIGADKISETDFSGVGRFFEGIRRILVFIGFLLAFPFVTIYKGFVYMIEFFGMCIDLIKSMYKKNCPVITWTQKEESEN